VGLLDQDGKHFIMKNIDHFAFGIYLIVSLTVYGCILIEGRFWSSVVLVMCWFVLNVL